MSDFLQMNLNRLSGIRDTTRGISDRRYGEKEAKKQRLYDSFKTGANVFTEGLAADKLAQAKLLEADKGRDFTERTATILDKRIQDAKDKARANYVDGSYKDPFTKETFYWDSPETFDMAMRSMEARISANLADRSSGEKTTDIYGAFQNTLGELSMIFPAGGLDPSTLMYDTEWMLSNKDAFESAFNEFTGSKYTKEEQDSLNRLLDSYLNSYELTPEESADNSGSDGGIFQKLKDWIASHKELDRENITGGYGRSSRSPNIDRGPIQPGETLTGGYYTAPETSDDIVKAIREDFYTTLGGIQTAQPPVHIMDNIKWDKLISGFLSLPGNLSSDKMKEIDKMMERTESGRISRTELNQYLDFLNRMRGLSDPRR